EGMASRLAALPARPSLVGRLVCPAIDQRRRRGSADRARTRAGRAMVITTVDPASRPTRARITSRSPLPASVRAATVLVGGGVRPATPPVPSAPSSVPPGGVVPAAGCSLPPGVGVGATAAGQLSVKSTTIEEPSGGYSSSTATL